MLNIETPSVSGDDLWDALKNLSPDLTAYFIGFGVIGLFWYGHSAVFSHLRRSSGPLMAANLLFLALIALMPFTTSLLGGYDDEPLAIAIFALNIGAAATVDSLIDQISYRGDLYEEGQAPELRTLTVEGLLRPALFLLSIPVAFVSTELAQLMWLAMLGTSWLANRIAGSRSA